jgi:RNA polymerase sigma-70 factor (ECF subfamily)
MRDDPATSLELIDESLARGDLENYDLAYAARAEMCRRLGKTAEARTAYQQALELAEQEPRRRYLQKQIETL